MRKIIQNHNNMGKIIAVINDKGGVAKTTTVMNLGVAMWILGKKVLLVDTDKQCNLTNTLDKTCREEGTRTIFEWMTDAVNSEIPVYERYKGLNFIPSSVNVDRLPEALAGQKWKELFLQKRLAQFVDDYDVILIDCAPGCGSLMNTNALVAADEILVPVRCDDYSIQGTGIIGPTVDSINEGRAVPLIIRGFLVTQYENTTIGREVVNFLRESNLPNMRTKIRKCVRCATMLRQQSSLFEFDADSTAADDYMMLAEELLGVQPRPKKSNPKAWGKKAGEAYEQFINEQNA